MTPDTPTLHSFIAGAITAGYAIAGFFFLKFWARTRDILFLAFAAAFLLLALNQALVTLLGLPKEEASVLYLLRLVGFALLIVAIVGKNVRVARPEREGPPPAPSPGD